MVGLGKRGPALGSHPVRDDSLVLLQSCSFPKGREPTQSPYTSFWIIFGISGTWKFHAKITLHVCPPESVSLSYSILSGSRGEQDRTV